MYRIYYTNPIDPHTALGADTTSLERAIEHCEHLRKTGMVFVTMVSDYQDMVGKPGACGAGSEYVPQLRS